MGIKIGIRGLEKVFFIRVIRELIGFMGIIVW